MFQHVGTQFLCTCPPNMELADLYSCVPKLYMTDPVKSEVISFKKKITMLTYVFLFLLFQLSDIEYGIKTLESKIKSIPNSENPPNGILKILETIPIVNTTMSELIADSARHETSMNTNKIMDLNVDTLREISSFPDSDRTQESTLPTVEVNKQNSKKNYYFFKLYTFCFPLISMCHERHNETYYIYVICFHNENNLIFYKYLRFLCSVLNKEKKF